MCTQSTEDIRGMRKIGRQDFLKSELKEAELKEAELKEDVLKIKEKATNLFKQKKFDQAKDTYLKCDVIDPTDKIYKSNIIACLIELQELDQALELCCEVEGTFETDNIDSKIRARIMQRKGTIFIKKKLFKESVKAFESSLLESKTDVVINLLIEAKQKIKEWDIIQNTEENGSDVSYTSFVQDSEDSNDYSDLLGQEYPGLNMNIKKNEIRVGDIGLIGRGDRGGRGGHVSNKKVTSNLE
jgi:tetratricopeptide (TPR) repeat protein